MLRVAESGAGHRAFLCLHGLVDDLAIWDRVEPALAARGRVVRIDQRAHGESQAPPGPCGRGDLVSDVRAVLDATGLDRVILVGHSMGGIVSMATALAHPERVAGLVLIGTASQCSAKIAAWYERIATAGERDGAEGLARAIYGERSRRRIRGNPAGIAEVTRMLVSLYEDPLTPQLGAIDCPVLLVVGDKDPMGPAASTILAEALPRAELVVVPECGHWVQVEEPEALVAALDRWLLPRKSEEGRGDA